MKSIKTKHSEIEVTDKEFELLSWLATVKKNSLQRSPDPFNNGMAQGMKIGLEVACNTLSINHELIIDICVYERFSGYRNMNILSSKIYFE